MKVDISIIGGAGPQAGMTLFNQIIEICQKQFGCARDYEFPYIELLSIPFSEMLYSKNPQVEQELSNALLQARGQQVVIACNTLHLYLTSEPPGLIHLMKEGAKSIIEPPVVLCSGMSRDAQLHQQFFPCIYPSDKEQLILSSVIDQVLANGPSKESRDLVLTLLQKYPDTPILLGCTEFSVLHEQYSLGKNTLDLSKKAAELLCFNHFKR